MQSFVYRNYQTDWQAMHTYLKQKEKKLINYIDTFEIIHFYLLTILYVN